MFTTHTISISYRGNRTATLWWRHFKMSLIRNLCKWDWTRDDVIDVDELELDDYRLWINFSKYHLNFCSDTKLANTSLVLMFLASFSVFVLEISIMPISKSSTRLENTGLSARVYKWKLVELLTCRVNYMPPLDFWVSFGLLMFFLL